MSKEYVVFTRRHNYDPEEFENDHVMFILETSKDDADETYEEFKRCYNTNKESFLLEVEIEDKKDLLNMSNKEFDEIFRGFYPKYDVIWVEDEATLDPNSKIKSINVLETTFEENVEYDEDYFNNFENLPEYESLDDLTSDEVDDCVEKFIQSLKD